MGRKRSRGGGQSSFQRNGADSGRGGRNNGWLDFASSPHGVGESRLAFRCRVEDGCYRGYTEGSYLIFKVFKPDPIYRQVSDVDGRDVHMQHCAVRLAQEFNEACDPTRYGESCNVYVRDAALGEFDYDRDLYDEYGRRFRVNDGQPFLLEREIRGSFEKFNSNSGWSSGTDPILEAFSHWTWVHTDGDHLVCDLQGHRGEPGDGTPYRGEEDYYYLLTDPAICSSCREFGESDLGPAGINSFFANHRCNEWCEHLDIEYERPQYAHAALARRRSTSYHSLS